jgi:hypothetical protein
VGRALNSVDLLLVSPRTVHVGLLMHLAVSSCCHLECLDSSRVALPAGQLRPICIMVSRFQLQPKEKVLMSCCVSFAHFLLARWHSEFCAAIMKCHSLGDL